MADGAPNETKEPTFLEIMGALRRPGVYLNVPVHVCILIPATCFIAYMATRIDRRMGWEPFIEAPWNMVLFALLFPLGVFIVWYTYGYLAIKGEGSPATHLGGTATLVTTGPFALCRHPSIIGKFIGVTSLGLLVGSPTFFFIIIPLLTTYSLVTVRFLQERHCVELWKDDYIAYRKRVPLVLPFGSRGRR
jgi:protein-S-isoprenylcysteine O-methyltransferase Ste14